MFDYSQIWNSIVEVSKKVAQEESSNYSNEKYSEEKIKEYKILLLEVYLKGYGKPVRDFGCALKNEFK